MLPPLLAHNDKLYQIIRKIPVQIFEKNKQVHLDVVKDYKEFVNADHVLRDGQNFIFCFNVDELEFKMINE